MVTPLLIRLYQLDIVVTDDCGKNLEDLDLSQVLTNTNPDTTRELIISAACNKATSVKTYG